MDTNEAKKNDSANSIPSPMDTPAGTTPAQESENKGKPQNKTLWIVIAAIILFALIYFVFKSYLTPQTTTESVPSDVTEETTAGPAIQLEEDTTETISQDLENTFIADIDEELKELDESLNSL